METSTRLGLTVAAVLALGAEVHAQPRSYRLLPRTGLPTFTARCILHHPGRNQTVVLGVEAANTLGTAAYAFDGTSWTRFQAPAGPVDSLQTVGCVADPTRGSIVRFGTTVPSGGIIETWELGGSGWVDRTPTGANQGGLMRGSFFHTQRGTPFVYLPPEMHEVDLAASTWSLFSMQMGTSFPAPAGYFPGRGVVAGASVGGFTSVAVLNGTTTWSLGGSFSPATFGITQLAYDARRGALTVIGSDPRTQVGEWTGSATSLETFTSGPTNAVSSLAYADDRGALVMIESSTGSLWELASYSANGARCTVGSTCLSGFCVDGVCCNVACGGSDAGDCQACAVAAGASVDGTCRTLPSTRTCRAANGACDVAETCNGTATSCPADGFASATTECRPANGTCDVADTCTGTSATCPALDAVATTSVTCRPSAGPCDVAERCDGLGTSCPADQFQTSVVCRSSFGPCDVEELCTGDAAECPNDGFAPSGTVCDASLGACDAVDTCTGSTAVCPEQLANDGTWCDDQNGCTSDSACRLGVCTETVRLDCSDLDPCTTDACQDTLGRCVHTPIAACLGDAGVDAGGDGGLDAGAGDASADAGAPPADAGGCSCRVAGAGAPAPSSLAGFLGLGVAGLVATRRRRRA